MTPILFLLLHYLIHRIIFNLSDVNISGTYNVLIVIVRGMIMPVVFSSMGYPNGGSINMDKRGALLLYLLLPLPPLFCPISVTTPSLGGVFDLPTDRSNGGFLIIVMDY